MSAPRHIGDVLSDLLIRIGLRAIGHHMAEARRLARNPDPEATQSRKGHVAEAIAISRTLQDAGLVAGPCSERAAA